MKIKTSLNRHISNILGEFSVWMNAAYDPQKKGNAEVVIPVLVTSGKELDARKCKSALRSICFSCHVLRAISNFEFRFFSFMNYSLVIPQFPFIPIITPNVMLMLMKHSFDNRFSSS